ncbi:reversion-inducing cysteine-rich protein with Kazal motifs isoform X2 [Hydra vulgaris]|uniref:Reversion-inducing cysteine-rich protein with Kazal motifs isoform X2 n=1 Tax=Hydra vulgaris TaxID=6087 RepID=A0ABM4CVV9_HYDVU
MNKTALLLCVFVSCSVGNVMINTRGLKECCNKSHSSLCKLNCREVAIFSTKKPAYFRRRLQKLANSCTRSEDKFWKEFVLTDFWKQFRKEAKVHRQDVAHDVCCNEAVHPACEIQCRTLSTKNRKRLENENCGAIREPRLAQCIYRIKAAENCCMSSLNEECKQICIQHFSNPRSDIVSLHNEMGHKCGIKSKEFTCAFEHSEYKSSIGDLETCCSLGEKKECVQGCKKAVGQYYDINVMFGTLSTHCGPFNVESPFYGCVIQSLPISTPTLNQNNDLEILENDDVMPNRGLVQFQKPCCSRGKSLRCRNWCEKAINSPALMGLWDTMYLECIQNPKEAELSKCMSDVLESCELGCKPEMQFCTNMNNRQLDLFRRCNSYGDSSARKLLTFWSVGVVYIFDYSLVFKDINTCQPELFKALACLLAVRPCDYQVSQIQVCRADCEDMLSTCLNFEQSSPNLDVQKVCAAMLPNGNQSNCLSVHSYVDTPNLNSKNPVSISARDPVEMPCHGNPCGLGEVCLINQQCNDHQSNIPCKLYSCVQGCAVGDESKLLIPVGHLAKLTVENDDKECYQVCECLAGLSKTSKLAYFGNCKEFGCNLKRSCRVNNRTWLSGETFTDECNDCICSDGDVICTNRRCLDSMLLGNLRPRRHHGLSEFICDCDSVYNPVCAQNGMTYPNSCYARCRCNNDPLHVGDCQANDPCDPNPCSPDLVCVVKRNTCLTVGPPCPQYSCLTNATGTFFEEMELCQKSIEYVCGRDGVTYKNQCEMNLAGTTIDYFGSCLPVDVRASQDRCQNVICPKIHSSCTTVMIVGSCCSFCGSFLRLLYSQPEVILHRNYIRYNAITVVEIITNLRLLLKASACNLHGHLTVEGDILVMFSSTEVSQRLLHICTFEAQRFNKYINEKNPKITSNYFLSVLKSSRIKSATWSAETNSAVLISRKYWHFILLAIISIIFNR